MGIPWASGPAELLKNGLSLLRNDSDTNRRLAMISIDNSVELMIKTYLGLPNRITGLKITRKEYAEFSESFPLLLDALEKYASDKITGINLGEIEWYHRLRNELYHQGNGLTVEKDKVTVYAELSNLLFENLFGEKLIEAKEISTSLLGEFMNAWIRYEKIVKPFPPSNTKSTFRYINTPEILGRNGVFTSEHLERFSAIRKIRNEVVHGISNPDDVITENIIVELNNLIQLIIENKDKWNQEN